MLPLFKLFSRSRRPRSATISTQGSFSYFGGGTLSNITTWGRWLQNQPAPTFKPNHRLAMLSTYTAQGDQEYEIALDECERWGYALNVQNTQVGRHVTDSQLASPITPMGKLLKLAVTNPTKYPVAGAITQKYPTFAEVPDGYLRNASGVQVGHVNGAGIIDQWSPEATPAALQLASVHKLTPLKLLADLGARIAIVYDGGEAGIYPAGDNPDGDVGLDPKVVAAKGSKSWVQYLSERQGVTLKVFYDAVKLLVPNRQVYGYYVALDAPYQNVAGQATTTFDYGSAGFNGCDVPTGTIYYRDYYMQGAAMGNPSIRDRSYFDTLTHFTAAVCTQIENYNRPHSYNFVSAGWKHNQALASSLNREQLYSISIKTYLGFLKCMYAAGQIGGVASYFSGDCSKEIGGGLADYPAYNPDRPPYWLLQQMALGEVQARFSWLDDYIFDGDLLPGRTVDKHLVKPNMRSYEFPVYEKIVGFDRRVSNNRCFVRKLRNINKWLVVVWAAEKLDSTDSAASVAYVSDIPGLPELTVLARPQGSIYTVDTTSGSIVVKWEDPPAPNLADAPKISTISIDPLITKVRMEVYSIRSLDVSQPLLASSFTVSGATVNSAVVVNGINNLDYVTLNITNNSLVVGSVATVAYNGVGLVDTETNILPASSNTVTIFEALFPTLADGIYFRNQGYYGKEVSEWLNQRMSSTKTAVGDCTIEADLYGSSMISLSLESTNTSDYRTWGYTCHSGDYIRDGVITKVIGALSSGAQLSIGSIGNDFNSFNSGDRAQLKRVAGVVTVSKKAVGATAWTLLGTYPVNSNAAMYLHGAFNGSESRTTNIVTTGFS